MRVLHVAYQQWRRYGKTRVSWAHKLTLGLIHDGHYVQVFSDRDVAALEAPFGIRDLGRRRANRRLLETVEAVEPDLVILGHCDLIGNDTLRRLRRRWPHIVLAHCNNDPLFVPDNVARLRHRGEVVDAVFVSTGWPELRRFDDLPARFHHMPNPVDASIENLDNSRRVDLPVDLLFCSNSTDFTRRLEQVKGLKAALDDELVFRTHGSFGQPPVWGRDYERALAATRMGLNLNRQEGDHWYSSARMAQLAGNGILVFTHAAPRFDELMPERSLVYFQDQDDLLHRVRDFHHDDDRRREWAGRARNFFHREMNSRLYARFIVESALGLPLSHDYVWRSRA